MDEPDGALGHGVVLVVECRQDPRQVTQRGNLVGQLALRAEQTNCCGGNCLQGFTLQETRDDQDRGEDQRCETAECKVCVLQFLCASTHVGVVFLQQLSEGLQEGHQELSRLAQHPAWLSDEDAQEDPTDLQLVLTGTIRHCEVLWNLRTQRKKER